MPSCVELFLSHELGDRVFTTAGRGVMELATESGNAKIIVSGHRMNAFDFLNNDLLLECGFRRFSHAPLVKGGA